MSSLANFGLACVSCGTCRQMEGCKFENPLGGSFDNVAAVENGSAILWFLKTHLYLFICAVIIPSNERDFNIECRRAVYVQTKQSIILASPRNNKAGEQRGGQC